MTVTICGCCKEEFPTGEGDYDTTLQCEVCRTCAADLDAAVSILRNSKLEGVYRGPCPDNDGKEAA